MMRYALALLVLLALQCAPGVGIGEAKAQTFACNSSGSSNVQPGCESREQAYAECRAAADAYPSEVVSCTVYGSPSGYQCYGTSFHACTPAAYRYFPFPTANGGCPVGSSWDEASKTCFSADECLAKPNLEGQTYIGTAPADHLAFEGCEFEPTGGSIIEVCLPGAGEGGADVCISASTWAPTGNPASPTDAAPQPMTNNQACTPAGDNLTFCRKANGDHCASASTGRQICWKPGETGEKTDGNVLQVRNAGGTPTTPTTTPPPGETFQQGDSVTTNTTVNNTSNVTTITNYTTSNGTNAGGSGDTDSGEAGDGTGDDGDNQGGTVGDGLGDVYEGSGKTLEGVWGAYKTRIEAAPIMAASTSFLTFTATASCPVWTVPASAYWPEMTADWLCVGPLADSLDLFGWMCLAVVVFVGFKWAVL